MGSDAAALPTGLTDALAPAGPPLVDAAALQRARARLLGGLTAPWLHAEVARRMADRLAVIRMQPQTVLDWGGRAGGGGPLLATAYPKASILAVEPEPGSAWLATDGPAVAE